jgi:hypothetical protein
LLRTWSDPILIGKCPISLSIDQELISIPSQKAINSSIKASILSLVSQNYNCLFMRLVVLVKLINESSVVETGLEQNKKKRKFVDKKKNTPSFRATTTSPGSTKRFKASRESFVDSSSNTLQSFMCKEFYLNLLNEPKIVGRLNYKKKYSFSHIDNHEMNYVLESSEVEHIIMASSLKDVQVPKLTRKKILVVPLEKIQSKGDSKLNEIEHKNFNLAEKKVSIFLSNF